MEARLVIWELRGHDPKWGEAHGAHDPLGGRAPRTRGVQVRGRSFEEDSPDPTASVSRVGPQSVRTVADATHHYPGPGHGEASPRQGRTCGED